MATGARRRPRAVDRRRRSSSCRSCSSPATPGSSPTSTASARCSSSPSRSRSSRPRSASSRSASAACELTYAVLFLIALQATFFSPAKYGILPEMLPDRDLSRANGVLEMSTFVAIVLGTAVGGFMFDVWRDRLWLIGVARRRASRSSARRSSFRIPHVAGGRAGRAHRPQSVGRDLDRPASGCARDRVLWLTVIGISYFWFLGSLLQLVDDPLRHRGDGPRATRWVGVLTTFAAIGIGAGSMAAGRLSGDKVELGPRADRIDRHGRLRDRCSSRSGHSFTLAAINLTLVGFFGGLFAVPLNALLQQRSGDQEKGRLMATNNFLNMVAIMLASGALCALQRPAARHVAGSHRPDRSASLTLLSQRLRALASCRSSSSASASGCSRTRSTASASSARSTCRSADRRCSSATTCRTSTACWSARACSASSASSSTGRTTSTGPSIRC